MLHTHAPCEQPGNSGCDAPRACDAQADARSRQLHTRCHWQFPKVSQTLACLHCEVPRGGIVEGAMGAIDGAMVGQIVGGQIGGRSIAFWQSGSICPSVHWQTHSASALQIPRSRNATAASCTRMFESLPPSLVAGSFGFCDEICDRPNAPSRAVKHVLDALAYHKPRAHGVHLSQTVRRRLPPLRMSLRIEAPASSRLISPANPVAPLEPWQQAVVATQRQ